MTSRLSTFQISTTLCRYTESLRSIAGYYTYVWVGARKVYGTTFRWNDGSSIANSLWHPGQPDNWSKVFFVHYFVYNKHRLDSQRVKEIIFSCHCIRSPCYMYTVIVFRSCLSFLFFIFNLSLFAFLCVDRYLTAGRHVRVSDPRLVSNVFDCRSHLDSIGLRHSENV